LGRRRILEEHGIHSSLGQFAAPQGLDRADDKENNQNDRERQNQLTD
jgi:hypothetical protein